MKRWLPVLVAALILAVPVWAEAKRAWVLWKQTRIWEARPPTTDTWDIQSVFETKTDCDAEQLIQQRLDERVNELSRGAGTSTAVRHICYPDTIDPRGPKGSGR